MFLNHMQENKGLVYTQCMLTKRQMDVTFLIGLQGDCQVVNMLVDPISSKKRQASFIIDTEGLVLCHERQNFFFFLVFLFQERCFPSVSFTSNSNFSFKIVWPASVHQPRFEI